MLSVLGSGLVYLEPLLAGEPVVSTVCNFGVVRTLETDRLTHARVLRGPWSCPFVCASPLLYGKFVCWARQGWGVAGREWWHSGRLLGTLMVTRVVTPPPQMWSRLATLLIRSLLPQFRDEFMAL